jgi:nitroreductase
MDIYDLIEKRRSVRTFREDPIPSESMDKLKNAMRLAPSAHNAQPYKFILVTEKELKKQVAEAASSQRFIATAPIIVVAVSLTPNDVLSSEVPTYALDIAIALDHLSLVAVEENLGTCWVGSFDQKPIKFALNIPEEYKIGAIMAIGTPYDDPAVKARKKIGELFCNETFSQE